MAIDFKGTVNGGICVRLPEDMEFMKLLREFYQHMDSNKSFFKKGNVVIHFTGRSLSSSDKLRLEAPVRQFCETWQIYYSDNTYSDSSGIRKTLSYKPPQPQIDEGSELAEEPKPQTVIRKQDKIKPEETLSESEKEKREEIRAMLHRWDDERMKNDPKYKMREITERWDRELERAQTAKENERMRAERNISVDEPMEKSLENDKGGLSVSIAKKCAEIFKGIKKSRNL